MFEVNSLELDKHGYGEEFLVTDKPSARGYQYSIMPSTPINSTGNNKLPSSRLDDDDEDNSSTTDSSPGFI